MDAQDELEIRKLIAERKICQQLYAYQEAINRADFDGLVEFFGDAEIATVSATNPDELHGVIRGGRQFVEGFKAAVHFYDGSPRVQYCAANPIVTVSDDLDRATCHAYYFIFQGLGEHEYGSDRESREFPLQVIGCGRYLDHYVCADGAWRITAREIYSDLSGDYSRHMRLSPREMAEDKGFTRQGSDDPRLTPTVRDVPPSASKAGDSAGRRA
jgi:hypothetical protein